MGIKLLPKSEIIKAQNAEKSLVIAEGLKISRKVDSLRELKAKEEEALNKFRNESLSAITKEIADLLAKKESIQKEADDLRREMMTETALSKEERLNLEKLKAALEKKEKEIEEREHKVKLEEIDIAITIQETKDSLARAATHEEEANRLHIRASNDSIDSKNSLLEARKIREEAIKFRENAEKEIELKEKRIAAKEKELEKKEQENRQKEEELKIEKIRLADQRATLERALNRIK
jgi:hypothetical protein